MPSSWEQLLAWCPFFVVSRTFLQLPGLTGGASAGLLEIPVNSDLLDHYPSRLALKVSR